MPSKLDIMEKGPVTKSILKLALPTMMGMAVQMVYNTTDTYFIGQTNDPLLVAGISLVMPLFFLIQGLGNIFAIGSASLISRLLGAKRFDEAKSASSVSFYTTILLGILISVGLLLFKDPLIRAIGSSPDTFAPANSYFSIIALFAVPMVLNVAMGGQIRAEGAATHAMIGMIIGLGLNIVLDPILILWLNMKAAGAAWATVIGAMCSVAYFISYFLGRKSMLSISPAHFKPSKAIYGEILKIGGPAALSQVVMSGSAMLNNIVAASFGDYVVAGVGVYMRVGSLCLILLMGLSQGYMPFAGYNFGAKNYGRLISGIKVTAIMSTALACAFGALFLLFGSDMIRFFINDPATVEAGTRLLHALVMAMPFVGIQLTLMVTFQALGKSVNAMIITLGRQCLFYIPLLFTLPRMFGMTGFVIAQPVADILTTAIAVILSLSLLKHIRKLSHDHEATIKVRAVAEERA